MSDRRVATVLVQAAEPRPGAARDLADALEADPPPGTVSIDPVLGAFDAVVTVHGRTPEAIAASVVRLQELDVVGDTLTLPWMRPADG